MYSSPSRRCGPRPAGTLALACLGNPPSGTGGPARGRRAADLERELYAGRLVYLRLATTIENGQATEVSARQYDLSDWP